MRVNHGLPAVASPTSEFGEEEIETPVALLQKGINIQLFLGYKYHLTCLCRKARVWSTPEPMEGLFECLQMEGAEGWDLSPESCTLGWSSKQDLGW